MASWVMQVSSAVMQQIVSDIAALCHSVTMAYRQRLVDSEFQAGRAMSCGHIEQLVCIRQGVHQPALRSQLLLLPGQSVLTDELAVAIVQLDQQGAKA